MMPLDNVAVEARSLINSQYAIDPTDDASNHASNDCAYRPGSTLPLARPAFDPAGDALSGGCRRDNDRGGKQGSDHSTAVHLGFLVRINASDKETGRQLFPLRRLLMVRTASFDQIIVAISLRRHLPWHPQQTAGVTLGYFSPVGGGGSELANGTRFDHMFVWIDVSVGW
jgi:hypothetical protein